jgi:hypothetical protein
MNKIFLVEGKKEDAYKRLFQKFPDYDNTIERILDSDPTGSRFITWIEKSLEEKLTELQEKSLSQREKIEQTQYLIQLFEEVVGIFSNNVNRITPKILEKLKVGQTWNDDKMSEEDLQRILKSPKDIFSYNLDQLFVLTTILKKNLSEKSKQKTAKKESDVIYDDGRYLVIRPNSHKASCYYGANTKWCTTAENDRYFQDYKSRGSLYYFIDRRNAKEKMAVFIPISGTVEIYNTEDKRSTLEYLINLYPFATDIINEARKGTGLMELIKKIKNGEVSLGQLYSFDEMIRSASRDSDGNIILNISFDDKGFWDLFTEMDDWERVAYSSVGSHYPMEHYDSYVGEEDWNEGYLFDYFNETQKVRLQEYLSVLFSGKLPNECLETPLQGGCRQKVASELQTFFPDEVEEIQNYYVSDKNSDVEEGLSDYLKKEYSNIFEENGLNLIMDKPFWKYDIKLDDLENYLEKNSGGLHQNLFDLLSDFVNNKTGGIEDFSQLQYQVSGSGDYDYTESAIEKLLDKMEEVIDDGSFEIEKIAEAQNFIKKIGGFNQRLVLPSDENYIFMVDRIDTGTGKILFTVGKKNEFIKKGFRLPLEDFKSFLYNKKLFDI